MHPLIVSGVRAVRSLFIPGMIVIFLWSVLVTIAMLVAFIACSHIFFSWASTHMQSGVMSHLLPWIGTGAAGIIAWMLFPGIMPVIVNFFDNRISTLIEGHEYPATEYMYKSEFLPEFFHDLRFTIKAIILNIIVLPLYLLPLFNLFVFFGLNGYLLGREFFVMAARRHMAAAQAEALRDKYSRLITITGALLTLLATIPLVNLFAPFWGVAVMVHLYHQLAEAPKAQILPPEKEQP